MPDRILAEPIAMAANRIVDEPLTDAELDELEAFLTSDAVPEDCMDLEMLDGYLTAIISGPEEIQPSEWLPGVWSEGGKSATPAYLSNEQAQRIMGLILRHMVGVQRTLSESPTSFRPLLYYADDKEPRSKGAAEAVAWCEGYMSGVKLRDDQWQALYDTQDARDWMFAIEALAFGDRDPEFAEWMDDREKHVALVDELPVASVLVYRYWQEKKRASGQARGSAGNKRRAPLESARDKSRQRLH
jgi:uncharacterized protein